MVKKFKYKLPFDCRFCYHHVVDAHNNLRHALPSIEYTWVTDWWEFQVFDFILAISEVNAFLILHYFFILWVTWLGDSYTTGVLLVVGVETY